MRHVILYGHLAKRFGRHHTLDVRSPGEAIRALQANFPEFRSHMLKHSEPGYHVRVGKHYRDTEDLYYPADETIRIVPAVGGSGSFGKIVLGAALIFAAPYAASWIFTNTTMVGLAVGVATHAPAIGMALMLGGISQMLFAPPKQSGGAVERVENKPSFAFDGPVNTVSQGNAVPICYGRMLVGSQVVSAGITTTDIPT